MYVLSHGQFMQVRAIRRIIRNNLSTRLRKVFDPVERNVKFPNFFHRKNPIFYVLLRLHKKASIRPSSSDETFSAFQVLQKKDNFQQLQDKKNIFFYRLQRGKSYLVLLIVRWIHTSATNRDLLVGLSC